MFVFFKVLPRTCVRQHCKLDIPQVSIGTSWDKTPKLLFATTSVETCVRFTRYSATLLEKLSTLPSYSRRSVFRRERGPVFSLSRWPTL